jgi:hypothetical protein
MKTTNRIILDKLIEIENRLIALENKLYPKKEIKVPKKRKVLITDEEAQNYLLKTVFKVNFKKED